MSIIMIHNTRITFPALAEPKAIGEGAPAWGGRFVIDPNSPEVAQIDKIMLDVAVGKWKEDGADVLAMLQASKKVCFEHAPYRSAKTGKAYAGFEGKFNLGTRSEKVKPTVLNKFGEKITDNREIEQLIYSGCYTHSKVEFWAQDNKFGRRINATLLGVMFAEDGESFGGGAGAASVDDFAGLAKKVDAESVL